MPIPDLEDRVRETEARYAEASKARQQKKKADDLKKELAWSHVASKKNEMEEAVQLAAKLARRLTKIEENVQSSEVSNFFFATRLGICHFRRPNSTKLPLRSWNWRPSFRIWKK